MDRRLRAEGMTLVNERDDQYDTTRDYLVQKAVWTDGGGGTGLTYDLLLQLDEDKRSPQEVMGARAGQIRQCLVLLRTTTRMPYRQAVDSRLYVASAPAIDQVLRSHAVAEMADKYRSLAITLIEMSYKVEFLIDSYQFDYPWCFFVDVKMEVGPKYNAVGGVDGYYSVESRLDPPQTIPGRSVPDGMSRRAEALPPVNSYGGGEW
jgi:hypothetical protein